jgi:membrane fusion protein (multidrug efflux system)
MGRFSRFAGVIAPQRRVWPLLSVVLCAAALAFPAAANAQGRSVPVIIYVTELVPYADQIEAIGTLRANETVQLTAGVADTITAINFEDGQRVEAGDILVEMTDTEEQALLTEARSNEEEAQAQFDRARELLQGGSISQATFEARRRDFQTAHARLEATRSRLQDHLVIAPFGGVVGLRNLSVGAFVSPGQVITTLNDDSVVKLDFSIPEVHLTAVHVGQRIEAVARALPGETFEGRIEALDTAIDPLTRSIRVRASLPNDEHRLIPGMLMTIDIMRGTRMAIVIPEDAPITEGRETFVWVVADDDTHVERRVITTGSRQPGIVEVTSGLDGGERIVTRGGANLRPGNTIEILGTDSGGESLSDLLSQNVTQ